MSFPDGPLTGAPVGIVQPGAGGPVSLQAAYNTGNTIVTAAGRVVSISGPEDVSVSSTVGPASASFTTTAGLATVSSTGAVKLDTGTGLELDGLGAGQIACASPVEARVALGGAFQNVRGADPVIADDLVTKRYVDALPVGEVNTASNLAGTGLFAAKVGADLQFKGITSTGGTITITPGASTVNLEAPGGGGGFLTTDIGYVDAGLGNDGTAAIGNPALPYLTVAAACAAASSGQVIIIRPGTYPESGIVVPAGVTVLGESWVSVRVGDPAAAAHVFDLGDQAYLQGVGIEVPATAGFVGVRFNGPAGPPAGLAAANLITFYGDGLEPSGRAGDGILKTGAGKLIAFEIRTELGGYRSLFEVTSGVLAIESVHVPNSAGTISSVARAGNGRLQVSAFNVGNTRVGRCLDVTGPNAICRIFTANWFDPAGPGGSVTGLYIGFDGPDIEITGGAIETSISVELDLAVVYTSATRVLLNVVQEPKFQFPASGLDVDFTVVFQQRNTNTRDSATRTLGTAVSAGFPEKGSPIVGGEGGPYTDGTRFFTTDATTGPASDGGNIIDITTDATSKTGPAVTFQSSPGVAGESILFTTQRFDRTGSSLAFFGVEVDQILGALDGAGQAPAPGTFVFEVWDGAAWSQMDVMAVSRDETYRYADDLFQRPIPAATSLEDIRFGLYGTTIARDTSKTWTPKSIPAAIASGTQYWCRIRLTQNLSQNPEFQRFQLFPSSTAINREGRRLATGLGLWKSRLFTSGGVWGSTAGVANGTYTLGNGASFPQVTSYDINRSKLNGSGDQVTFQFPLPPGLCTAFPLMLRPSLHLTGSGINITTAGVLTVGGYTLESAGIQVADPAGGIVPVPRPYAGTNGLTTLAGQGFAQNIVPAGAAVPFTTQDRIFTLDYGPYLISNLYDGDVIATAIEYTTDSTPASDVQIWSLEIEGVAFFDGPGVDT